MRGHRGTSAAPLADGVMARDGVVACRVIDVGGGELLAVGLFASPVTAEVGAGEILVSRERARVIDIRFGPVACG